MFFLWYDEQNKKVREKNMEPVKKQKHLKKKMTRGKKNNKKMMRNILLIVVAILIVIGIIFIAPNFMYEEDIDKIELVLNNNNVTSKLKQDVYMDQNGNIYLSEEDMQNYFDRYIRYDKETELLTTTSDKKVAKMKKGEHTVDINGSKVEMNGALTEQNGVLYLPFSDLSRNVFNAEVSYLSDENIVIVESLDRELKKGDMAKNARVKSSAKYFSKTVDKVEKGEKVVVVSTDNGWSKIRTERGKIGYVKEDTVANIITVRENMEEEKQVEGKINMVWDYYSQVAKAPDRTGETIEGVNVVAPAFFSFKEGGNGEIVDNAGQAGREYIEWAHENGYKVWPIFSNSSMLNTTSSMLNDEETRNELINVIVSLVEEYGVDGINLDFEHMKQEDKDIFSQFVIELAPRLRDMGKVLSVDVTAPDGAETWSLCYDRDVLAHVADYMVFMAYDQNGISSPEEGTTAGYNWVENNIKKFLGQEDVDANKLILGIPFYTRLWTERDGEVSSRVVFTKDVDSRIPDGVEKTWDDTLKQNYVEWSDNGATYKMWIEDETSIREKVKLANQYNLAGVSFWSKDREPDSIWSMISEELQKGETQQTSQEEQE